MKFVIIGSGPTALGAAYRLNQLIEDGVIAKDTQVVIIEKESEVGGLARSVTDPRGFTWDLGVHVTGSSKYLEFMNVINKAVVRWNNVSRCVKAYMRHVIRDDCIQANYVPYPVQDSIPYFPEEIKLQCLSEISNAVSSGNQSKPSNFAEFSANSFGLTLQKEFIRPYNEKVWTVPLEKMNCAWVENRVPRSNIDDLSRRCQLSRLELIEEEEGKNKLIFKYPKDLRGIGAMWRVVASDLPKHWFKFNAPVTRIDVERKRVYLPNRKYTTYDHIISTIPIVELGRFVGLSTEIDLKYSKVVLVGIGLRRPQPEFTENLSWLYFPLPDTVFYRCTFISNFNELLTPNAALFWSVICEIGIGADEAVNLDGIADITIRDLISHGILTENSCVEDRWVHVLPFGYPIPTLNRDHELTKFQELFEKQNIYSRGRFGGWKYEVANQDHSFTMGLEVVDRIVFGTKETVYS